MTRIRARIRAPRKANARPVSRAARQLALAHHIERVIEAGTLTDYAAAARALGITRARLTQIMNLLLLAPDVQHRILVGEIDASERALRAASGETSMSGFRTIFRMPTGGMVLAITICRQLRA